MCSLFFVFTIAGQSQSLEIAFEKAGANKKELKKVLKHFKKSKDSLKYKAAVFLIENMPINYGIHCEWFDQQGNNLHFNEMEYADFVEAKKVIDTMLSDKNSTPKQVKVYDVTHIKATFLIENIEYAFKVWKQNPWSKQYDFKTFCEYILPYRNVFEPLQDWRETYSQKNKEAINEVKTTDEPLLVLGQLMKEMQNYDFVFNRKEPIPTLGAQQALFRKQGTCLDYASLALYNSRSEGLATTFDFTPHYAASSNRHFWNTIVDTDGTHIPFDGYEYAKGIDPVNKRLAKVLRRTYSIQKNSLASLFSENDIPEGFLRNPNFIDATNEYIATTDVTHTFSTVDKVNYGLIHVFNLAKWQPVYWANVTNEGKAVFKDMGRDVVYLPGYFSNGTTVLEKYPILIKENGMQKLLNPNQGELIANCRLSRDNELKKSYIDYNPFDIETGKRYKLFHWNDGWKQIGSTQIAEENALFYKSLPVQGLYFLIPVGEYDGFERIFTINAETNQITWY